MTPKYVDIALDQPRRLRFNLAAIRFVEETTGRSFLHKFSLEKASDIAVVLYAGLKHEDKDLTLEAVEDMIDLDSLPYVAGKIQEAFEATAPKQEKAESDSTRPTKTSRSR